MLASALFNEQNKEPILLSIIAWFVLGKQNVQAKKVCWINQEIESVNQKPDIFRKAISFPLLNLLTYLMRYSLSRYIYIPAVAESHDWNNGKLDLPLCGLLSLEQFLEEKRLLVKSSFQREIFCSRKRTPWNNKKRFFSPCAFFRLINNKWWTHLVTFTGLSNLSKAISWLMPIGLWYKGCMIILLTVKSCSTPVVSLLLCEPSLRKNKKNISELERKQRYALWICG